MPEPKKPKIPVAGLPKTKRVKIRNVIPEDIPLHYSDNMLIQHRDGMFILSFMQTQNPVFITAEDAKNINEVKSIAKGRVIMPALYLARCIKAMEENFTKFLDASDLDVKNYKEFLEKFKAEDDDEQAD